MSALAVTVVGADRPGIIAAVAGALADLGGNIEDSSMTILRGHFAMTLVVAVADDGDEVKRVLRPVAERLGVVVTVAEVGPDKREDMPATHVSLAVHGADRPGILARFMGVVFEHGGNVTDLTTRLAGGLYVVVADIDLPEGADAGDLDADLRLVADELGVDAVLRSAEADVL